MTQKKTTLWATLQERAGDLLAREGEVAEGYRFNQAVERYQLALRVNRRETDPAAYARTQFGLGVAYLSWADQSMGIEHIRGIAKKSVAAFREALAVRAQLGLVHALPNTKAHLADAIEILDRVSYRSTCEPQKLFAEAVHDDAKAWVFGSPRPRPSPAISRRRARTDARRRRCCESRERSPEQATIDLKHSARTGFNMADIRHLVVLMLENRSFDHMLGYLKAAGMEVDGANAATNVDDNGNAIKGYHLDSTRVRIRPHHERDNVKAQVNDGKMDGFLKGYGSRAHLAEIMGWYDQRDVLTYDALARKYAVCDRWFSSFAGPTWPNRFFAMCGTSTGITTNMKWIDHPTLFDLLPPGSWRYYSQDIAFLRTVEKYKAHIGDPITKISSFYKSCLDGTLPQVSWLDPNFTLVDVDALLNWANDDHPPADIARGQNLVARVYNHLVASPAWKNTLFVVLYDEHGGFYDHVEPPESPEKAAAPFDRLGVRVPAIVISPWVPRGIPFHGTLDHTCLARTAFELFAPQQVNQLSPRVAASPSLLPLLTEVAPRTDEIRLDGIPILELAVAPIRYGDTAPVGFHSMELSENQEEIEQLKQAALDSGVPVERH